MVNLLALLLAAVLAYPHAEVAVSSREVRQAHRLFAALNAVQVRCPDSLAGADSSFFCAEADQDARALRAAVDRVAAPLRPTGPWASYTVQNDQQRSYLYKDGFLTVTYFPPRRANGLVVVQYALPHD